MIDPQHSCYWTRKRRTDLILDENRLASAGVSLRVLSSALVEPRLAWYSITFGEFDDNVAAIAVAESRSRQTEQLLHVGEGPIGKSLGGLFPVTEYLFTETIAREFHIAPHEVPPASLPADVQFCVAIHDDCMASLGPVDDPILCRLMTQILELHSFYLEHNFDWAPTMDRLIETVKQRQAVRLESRMAGRRNGPSVKISIPDNRWTQPKYPRFVEYGRIEFDSEIALLALKE